MAKTSDILGLLTICRRAGKLVLGMDEVKSACRAGKAKGVIVADDLSPKSFKEAAFVCEECGVPIYQGGVNMEQIGESLGKVFGVMAIADSGFMKAAAKKLKKAKEL